MRSAQRATTTVASSCRMDALLVLQDPADQPAHHLRRRVTGAGLPREEVLQPVEPEEGAALVAGLRDAVGVQHHPVPWLEHLLPHGDVPRRDPEDRTPSLAQQLHHLASADHEREGMTGADVAQPPRVQVQLGQHGRHRAAGLDVGADHLVDRHHLVEQRPAGTSHRPVCRHRRRRDQAGLERVPHGVEDRQVRRRLGEGVVERVSPDAVAGLDHPGDRHLLRAGRRRRDELPHELGRAGHRPRCSWTRSRASGTHARRGTSRSPAAGAGRCRARGGGAASPARSPRGSPRCPGPALRRP